MQFILETNKRLFRKCSTEHLRLKLYEQESLYILAQLFKIGEDTVFLNSDEGNTKIEKKTIYATHVPLKSTLEAFFKVPGIFNQMWDCGNSLSKDKTIL